MKILCKIIGNKKGQERTIGKVTDLLRLLLILAIVALIIILITRKFFSPAPSQISKLINRGGG